MSSSGGAWRERAGEAAPSAGRTGSVAGPDPRQVVVIGPGRVGLALALGLADAGYRIAGFVGRGERQRREAQRRFPDARVTTDHGLARQGGLIVVAVGDDDLEGVVREAALGESVEPGSRWVHASGRYGLDALRGARAAGARTAAIHPAQTFPDPDTGHRSLPGTAWAVTADPGDIGWARVLVTDLRGSPFGVRGDMRTLYHAGLTVGSNATASVVTLAGDLLRGAGIDEPEAFLAPLVRASSDNATARGAEAITGPVRRGDARTVAAHLAELDRDWPEAAAAYRSLARLLLAQSRRAGLDSELADRVAEALGDR